MSLAISFDYLQGTGFVSSLSDFEEILFTICDHLPVGDSWAYLNKPVHIGQMFSNGVRSVRGKLYGGVRCELEDYKYVLQIPGSFFSQLNSDSLFPFVQFLVDNSFNFTRCDISLDDYKRRVDFNNLKQIGGAGLYRFVENYKCIEESIIRGTPPVPTCYFGTADKKLRFYNAEVVHGIKADRWELQLRDNHARSVVTDYLAGHSLGYFVTGAVDFGVISEDCTDFVRFPWWQSIIEDLGGASKITLPDFIPCFDRSVMWLYNQVAPTLAVAYYGYGQEKFNDLIFGLIGDGSKRLKPYHLSWITELKKEFENV